MGELFTAFGINWKLLVIQTVNFGVLLLILWKYLYTPVLRMIDERRGKIAEAVTKAEAADRRLAEADATGKETIATAAKEADGLIAAARSRADEEAATLLKQAQERADAATKDAAARAEEARRQILAESEKEVARAAMLAAEKILKQKHS